MSFAVIDSSGFGLGQNGGTSVGFNTTGASLLILNIGWYALGTLSGVSDSKSNTWTALTLRTVSNSSCRIYYAKNPTVGTAHTFTVSGSNFYPGVVSLILSGAGTVIPFDQESGSTGASPRTPGSITPSYDNSILVSTWSCADSGAGSIAVDSGFTQVNLAFSFGTQVATSLGYKIQTAKAAANPSWSWTGGFSAPVAMGDFLVPLPQPGSYTRSSVSG
jgi:hypothetical protein